MPAGICYKVTNEQRIYVIDLFREMLPNLMLHLITSLPRGKQSTVMSVSVCLSASISQKPVTTRPNFTKLHQIAVHVDCDRGSYVLLLQYVYVLPVSWMTSRCHTVGPMAPRMYS